MIGLWGKLVCLSTPVTVTGIGKDTSLLHHMSIFRTVQSLNASAPAKNPFVGVILVYGIIS
jgi:hypothetical protein